MRMRSLDEPQGKVSVSLALVSVRQVWFSKGCFIFYECILILYIYTFFASKYEFQPKKKKKAA